MNRNLRKLEDRRQLPAKLISQVSLRTLLLLMVFFALGILFLQEITERYGLVAALVAVLAGLSIFAHVAGAALGSRLRMHASGDPVSGSEQQEVEHRQPLSAVETDFAPITELSQQQPLTRRPIYWAVGIGAGACATLAAVLLTLAMRDSLAIVNVLFGAFSAAVIGGLLGFWVSSFFQVVRSALANAQKEA